MTALNLSSLRNLMFLLLLLVVTQVTAASTLFWNDHISTALDYRDEFFNSLNIPIDSVAFQNWDSDRKTQTLETLDLTPFLDNPWYHITRGFIDGSLSNTNQDIFFNRALFLAQSDPGTIWLFFIEFEKNNLPQWADKSLELLQKSLFKAGAYSSKIVSLQLLHLGLTAQKENSPQAQRLFQWAQVFDQHQTISSRKIAWMNFPFDMAAFVHEYQNVVSRISSSWILQLQFITVLYNWFRSILICFIISTILLCTIKYLPYSIHKISDLMPFTIPLAFRTPLIGIAFFSFGFIGVYPLLWLSSFMIWKFATDSERVLIAISLCFLVLSPIDSYIRGGLYNANDPDGILHHYSRAVNEGFSKDQYDAVLSIKNFDKNDYLALTTAAVYELKSNDFVNATINIRNASTLRPNDPIILNVAGNLHFLKNDIETAKNYYSKIISGNKKNAEALFNLAQCQLRKLQTIQAAEHISDAAHIKPDFINTFIHSNEKHFSRNWPPIRQIMFADLAPFDFWTHYFPKYALSWSTATLLWNPIFFTIPPVFSIILSFVALMVLLALANRQNDYRKVKKLFECRFCGRVLCRKCKSGTLCSSCHEATRFMSNEKSLEKMRLLISRHSKQISLIRNTILEILFPGAGQLLEKDLQIKKTVLTLIATSLVYATYFLALNSIENTYSTFLSPQIVLILFLFSYNVYFIIKRVQLTVWDFKKHQIPS